MADRIKYTFGGASIEVTGPQRSLIEKVLKEANAELYNGIEAELEALKKSAMKNWPVRQVKKSKGGRVLDGSKTKNSRGKIATQIRIIPPATIQGSIQNTAPYAYAIRSGEKERSVDVEGTPIRVKPGQRVVEKLIFKPGEKGAQRLAQIIAEKVMKDL